MAGSKRTDLEELLLIYQKNRNIIEKQIGTHGGDANAAMNLLNDRHAVDEKIAELLNEIAGLLPDEAVHIDLSTRAGGLSNHPDRIQLDWAAAFERDAPTEDEWRDKLLPDLRALLARCSKRATRVLAVHPKAHITAAIALGSIFPTVSAFQLWVEQRPDEWWRANDMPASEQILEEQTLIVDRDKPQFSVEVSVARDVSADVEDAIEALALPVGRRIQLRTPKIPGHINSGREAKKVAEQVRAAIIDARAEIRKEPIHFFAAVPVGLAVLIGAHLNACGPIQCYEYRRDYGKDYVSACML